MSLPSDLPVGSEHFSYDCISTLFFPSHTFPSFLPLDCHVFSISKSPYLFHGYLLVDLLSTPSVECYVYALHFSLFDAI